MTGSAFGDLDEEVQEILRTHPPSVKVVYGRLLHADEPLTRDTIEVDCLLPSSTAKRALRELHDDDLVQCEPDPDSPAASRWWATPQGPI